MAGTMIWNFFSTRLSRTLLRRTASGLLVFSCLSLFGCFPQQLRLPTSEKKKDVVEKVLTIGDVTEVANATPIQVSGVGIITNLQGTGGGNPPGKLREDLETELRKRKFKNVKQLLDSPDTAMVIVTGLIPAGSRKGDPIDVIVTLPPMSKVTSLQGGILQPCYLRNFDSTKNLSPDYKGGNRLLPGHVLAKAQGPLLVGLDNTSEDESGKKQGRIWEGGISNIDRPFFLVLKNDKKSASVANSVALRINSMFQDDIRKQMEVMRIKELMVLDEIKSQINSKFSQTLLGDHSIANAANKELIFVNVPWEYRLNQKRYLRVLRLIPMREIPDERVPYREKLKRMLLDPAETIRAALRLESLGKESLATLKTGLESDHPLVRFSSAEALTYLGSTAGIEELAKLAENQPQLRAYCLTAMAGLDESICHTKLRDLLASNNAETRYGAFRALQILEDQDPQIAGVELNKSFFLHRVAPESEPMIHYSLNRRAEVVLFGKDTQLVPPFRFTAGTEFTVTATARDNRCTIERYLLNEGKIIPVQCSFRTEDVLRTMAEMGATYPTIVDLLRQANDWKCMNCTVVVNAIPQPTSVEKLAEAGRDPDFLKSTGEPSAQLANGTRDLRLNEEAELREEP